MTNIDPATKEEQNIQDVQLSLYPATKEELDTQPSLRPATKEERDTLPSLHPATKEELDIQLSLATKKSSKKLAEDLKHTRSAYIVHEPDDSDSFIGSTLSWYNPYVHMANIFVILVNTVCLFMSSYLLAFDSSLIYYYISLSSDFCYSLLMFLHSRTGVMIDGVEERNLLKVRQRYQTSLVFFLELIALFPIGMMRYAFPNQPSFYVYSRQKSYLRIYFVLVYLGLREEEPGSSTVIYRTMKFCFASSLVIHLAACGWYGLACARIGQEGFKLSLCDGDSWIMHLPLHILEKVEHANTTVLGVTDEVSYLHDTFVTSLYWSSATTTSTGYGDIHAYTTAEKLYSIFTMIIGMAVLYGMTMGGITSMLTNIDARRSSFVHRYVAFRAEVQRMGVSEEVRNLCLRYFDYLWHRWDGEDIHHNGSLGTLPPSLQASFSTATFKQLIGKADLLDTVDEGFSRNLALAAKPMVYLKNQFIQRSGEIASAMCFIQSGIVEVLDPEEKEVVAVMHEGKVFGQILLVFDLPRINSIRCKTNCDVFVLNKHDFRQVLSEYPVAAAQFVEATRKKCEEGGNMWPMKAPSMSDFSNCIKKASDHNKRMSLAANGSANNPGGLAVKGRKLSLLSSGSGAASSGRRMSTACSTDYEGVDLTRINLHKEQKERQPLKDQIKQGPKPSLVDFLVRGKTDRQPGQRSATLLTDGTEMIAEKTDLKELKDAVGANNTFKDPDKTTTFERLASVVLFNPSGRFLQIWKNYIFLMSFFTGMYTTFMVVYTTSPGMEKIITGSDIASLPLMSIATDTAEAEVFVRLQKCYSIGVNATLDCIRDAGGVFGSMITGNSSVGYSVTVPATYDISHTGHNSENSGGIWQILISYLIIDMSFYVNIFINFRTWVETPNGILTSFRDIRAYYFRWNRFWIDILSVFPIEILAPMLPLSRIARYHAWAYFRLNRVLNYLHFIPQRFSDWEYSLDVQIVRVRAIKFLIYVYSITHACGCLFYYWSCSYVMQIDQLRFPTKCRIGSWAWVYDIGFDTTNFHDYIMSIYWASTTMTSTGYGDISATTTTGRKFALATMILGTIMYGWLVAVIASTVSNSVAAFVSFSNSIQLTRNYLDVHSVPKCLIDRVLNCRYLEWHRFRGTATPGIEAIGRELPDMLNGALLYESVSTFLKAMPFFHEVDASFIAMLCSHVQMYHYTVGDIVTYEGDLSRNLYIIKQGHCYVVTSDLKYTTKHFRPGDYFGETEVLFGCASPRTVVVDTACEILLLSRESIDNVLQSYPILQAQMENIENDTAYRQGVIDAIARKKQSGHKPMNMNKRFEIRTVKRGIYMYGDELAPEPLFNQTREEGDAGQESELYAQMSSFMRALTHLLLPHTFNPTSKMYIWYESVRVVLMVASLIIVPVLISLSPHHAGLIVVQYLLDFFCLVDQYIKLHTMYFNDRQIIVSHQYWTATHYLKTNFVFDLLCWFPIELFALAAMPRHMTMEQWKFIAVLKVGRMMQAYKVLSFFQFWLDDIRYNRRWIRHLGSILFGILVHHWMACLLMLSACPPDAYENVEIYQDSSSWVGLNATGETMHCKAGSWITKVYKDFPTVDVMDSISGQYFSSIYWATATLVCVGYGDLHAYKEAEMVTAIFIMVVGTVFYSFVLGDIAANIQTGDIQRGHFKDRMSDIVKFFKLYNVTKETKQQVLSYYVYLWYRTRGVIPKHLLRGLPLSLRTSVCQSMYDSVIREAFGQSQELKSEEEWKETEGFFRLISTHIEPRLCQEKSIICRRGDVGEEMYFIQRGNVAILEEDDTSIAAVLGPGQHFGEMALLFASPRSRTITALSNCDLNILNKKDLDDILDKFPKFRDQMVEIAKDRKMKGTSSKTYNRPPSQGDMTTDIAYDQKGNRSDDKSNYRWVVNREGKFLYVWNHITVVLGFFSACVTVYQACFQSHNWMIYVLGCLIDIWFGADMIISFHTSFVDQFYTNVDNLDKVHVSYARDPRKFLFDAVTNLPLEIFGFAITSPNSLTQTYTWRLTAWSYMRQMRLFRMKKVMSICSSWELDVRMKVLVVRMYKFGLIIAVTINTAACFWFFVACPGAVCDPNSWTGTKVTDYVKRHIHGFDLLVWIDSIYWATATMTSTGYGDIKPETVQEMIFSCFVMVIGKIIIGYVLGIVAATSANNESLRVWYEQRVMIVRKYMKELNFSNELFVHVVQYYDYMWMKNRGVDVMRLFPDLPFSLRADIYNQICREMVDGLELFKGTSSDFRRHLCMEMHPTAYMPGEYICMQGDIRSEMYVLKSGVAEALKKDKSGNVIPLRLVQEGEGFLCESLLTKVYRPCSLKAKTYVDVFSMTMVDLQSVLQYYPEARTIIIKNGKKLYPTLDI